MSRDERVAGILEHWYRVGCGADYERACRRREESKRLESLAASLMARAVRLDPNRESAAWRDYL